MNYRHAFHAGNFADLVKHLILTRILLYLRRKEAPFRVLDTHAGVGLYDLAGGEAGRTGEWAEGVKRLFDQPLEGAAAELAEPYLDAVLAQNPDGGLRFYPGSPRVTRHLMRAQDRLFALEKHPADARALARNFAGDFQARITELDGWAALGTHLPPKERRGLALLDPPFEEPGEWRRLVDGLVKAHGRWPGGIYALWYPIKETSEVTAFVRDLHRSAIPKILRLELTIRAPSTPPRLHGTGMIVVNPPFVLEEEMRILLPPLAERLADEGRGRWLAEWVRGE